MLIFPLKLFVMQLVKGPFEVPTRGSRGGLSPHFRVMLIWEVDVKGKEMSGL